MDDDASVAGARAPEEGGEAEAEDDGDDDAPEGVGHDALEDHRKRSRRGRLYPWWRFVAAGTTRCGGMGMLRGTFFFPSREEEDKRRGKIWNP